MPASSPILSIRIYNLSILQSAYMPFLNNGGLFVSLLHSSGNNRDALAGYKLNDRVCLIVKLLDDADSYIDIATVVWITPIQSRTGQCKGVGFHFEQKDSRIKLRIKSLLEDYENSTEVIQTL